MSGFVLVFINGMFWSELAQLFDFNTLYLFPASGRWFCLSQIGMIHYCFLCMRNELSSYIV
jgi:hypothetical protein